MPKITITGKHTGKVTSAEFGESNNGTPFLRLSLENTAGEYIGAWIYLSEAALVGAIKTLREAFKFDGNFETCIAQITDKPCSFQVEMENFDGQDRLKVKWINGPSTTKPIADQGSFLKNLTTKAARIPEGTKPVKAATGAVAPAKDPF